MRPAPGYKVYMVFVKADIIPISLNLLPHVKITYLNPLLIPCNAYEKNLCIIRYKCGAFDGL